MKQKKKEQERVNKQNPVGNFFERATQRVVGGKLMRNHIGDIYLEEENTVIEVKATCLQSSYGFRLDTDQIDRYAAQTRFPEDRRVWYALCAYDNPRVKNEWGKSVTGLSLHQSVPDIEGYLAARVRWIVLVDFALILKWRELLPHSTKSIQGHLGTETVNLHAKRIVYPFANGGLVGGLRGLGLVPQRFRAVHGKIKAVVHPDPVEKLAFDKYSLLVPEFRAVVPGYDLPVVRRVLHR